ncbi:Glutathione S-transferase omega-like 2 [Escovopsis weberi]|uniref:Glutathione S-transferase omega-like 2 n=1 Tax=Escovopsis weberi TaxID=150374 RepID=A0A0M9VX74_ESCWE|nr:Glutathione S-transferase omega-like 2 [Escovopsis weberi]
MQSDPALLTRVTLAVQSAAGKITDWVKKGDTSGEYKRQTSSFRRWISSEPGAEFPPEKGRYHLYASYACPWAHRTLITRKLKGLEDFISYSIVHWRLAEGGWRFVTKDENEPGENVIPDPMEGHEDFTHLRHVYFETDKDYDLRFTVPVLYDKKTKQIVSNESAEILRMFGSAFDDLLEEKYRAIQPYPEGLRSQIDETHEWTYNLINNGVYKSGFATTSEAYENHVFGVFEGLDRAEKHIAAQKGPYYYGDSITEADIRLYVSLIRFDPVYVQHFKCNIRDIRSGYPHLHRWMRNLYWNHPAFHSTTQFDHIKWHYTRSHTQINPLSITPVGPLPHVMPLDEEVPAVMTKM